MANFLNDPDRFYLLDSNMAVTTEPLLFQFAGSEVPKELVDDYLRNWQKPDAYKSFLSHLPEDVQIWLVPAGKVTDGPSMPGYAVMAGGGAIAGALASIGLDFVQQEILIAGLSGLGATLRGYMKPVDFYLSGILHDDLRVKLSTGNATTDGFLRDACTAEAAWKVRSYLVYLGVRLGTLMGYKTKVKEAIQKEALRRYAKLRNVDTSKLWFDEDHSEIRYTIKDTINFL